MFCFDFFVTIYLATDTHTCCFIWVLCELKSQLTDTHAFFFRFIAALAHAIVVVAVCTPTGAFEGGACVYLMVYFLRRTCSPAEGPATITTANANIVGYALGLAITLSRIPSQYTDRYAVVFVLAVLDYFCCIGHTWDRSPTLETIANCRLFWACGVAVNVATLYAAWSDPLITTTH